MKTIRVSLADSGVSDDTLRRFDDAKEDLYGKLLLEFKGVAELSDLDSSARQFHVQVSATRHLGVITILIRQKLKHHRVAECATIERL
jgi:hypothetical protein